MVSCRHPTIFPAPAAMWKLTMSALSAKTRKTLTAIGPIGRSPQPMPSTPPAISFGKLTISPAAAVIRKTSTNVPLVKA